MVQSTAAVVGVFDSKLPCPELPLVPGNGNAKGILRPGNGARLRTFRLITPTEGDRTIDLRHGSDCVYYMLEGTGDIVDLLKGERQALAEGSMLHIDAGDRYRLETVEGVELPGGPCAPDPELYADIKFVESAL